MLCSAGAAVPAPPGACAPRVALSRGRCPASISRARVREREELRGRDLRAHTGGKGAAGTCALPLLDRTMHPAASCHCCRLALLCPLQEKGTGCTSPQVHAAESHGGFRSGILGLLAPAHFVGPECIPRGQSSFRGARVHARLTSLAHSKPAMLCCARPSSCSRHVLGRCDAANAQRKVKAEPATGRPLPSLDSKRTQGMKKAEAHSSSAGLRGGNAP